MREVTSLADLQVYAQGQVVELPGFFAEEPFVARLRRPSLLALTKSGKIPNALLSAANELFTGKQDKSDPVDLSEIMGVLEVICESALLEPTYKDVVDAGLVACVVLCDCCVAVCAISADLNRHAGLWRACPSAEDAARVDGQVVIECVDACASAICRICADCVVRICHFAPFL